MIKVLVVDDEVWMCKTLNKIIEEDTASFVVTGTAKNGAEALDILERSAVDLVLTDIKMPFMDGIQLMEQMRMKKMEQPVILITGFEEFQYARQALRLGAYDYLSKPIKKQEVLRVLASVETAHFGSKVSQTALAASDQEENRRGIQVIEWVKEVVDQQYHEDLSLSIIAEKMGFNPSYLSRLFKEEAGISFVKYLTKKRMEEAQKLLEHTRLNVSDVSKSVGYFDEKHFSKIFKREVGVPPNHYRKDAGK
mgnify:CR=1 FL=1